MGPRGARRSAPLARALRSVRMCREAAASILRQPPSPIPRPRSRGGRPARRARPASRSFAEGRRRGAARSRWMSHRRRRDRTRGFGRGEGRGRRSCRGCEGCPVRSRSGPGRRGRGRAESFAAKRLAEQAVHAVLQSGKLTVWSQRVNTVMAKSSINLLVRFGWRKLQTNLRGCLNTADTSLDA